MARITRSDDGGNSGLESDNVVDPRTAIVTEQPAVSDDRGNDASTTAPVGSDAPKRRGRPPGSKNGERANASRKASSLSVDGLAFSLSGIHGMLSIALSTPELALTPSEAEYVAKSYVAWAQHHDTMISQETMDTGNLILALTVVYGGRLVGITKRRNEEKRARRAGIPLTVAVQEAPQTHAATSPSKTIGVKPNGAAPSTRPRTPQDNAMLDEPVMPMFMSH